MQRVTGRLARDFWVQPSEGMIRHWCRTYSAQFDFEVDYQSWVVSEISGILCVDEVYQDQMALLLAVDPASPGGDWLIGYRLVHGNVSASDTEQFLSHLQEIGVEPDQVITDGSKLYPTVLAQVRPSAAHQLCLFHETRHITNAVMKLINTIRKEIPHPPPRPSVRSGGPLHAHPSSDDPTDPAAQRWYWRQADRGPKSLKFTHWRSKACLRGLLRVRQATTGILSEDGSRAPSLHFPRICPPSFLTSHRCQVRSRTRQRRSS